MNLFDIVTEEQKWCLAYLRETGFNLSEASIKSRKLTEKDLNKYTLVRVKSSDKFSEIAAELKELWPKGSREINGKEYPWQDSLGNISKRLSVLFKKRRLKKYTKDDVLVCARRYLSRYENDTSYMKSLQFWIIKYVSVNGTQYELSVLADMLENKEVEDSSNFIDNGGQII